MRTFMILLVLLPALASADGDKKDYDYDKAIKAMAQKNVFAPFKPKPKPRPKVEVPKARPKPKPKQVDVREELVVTGILWDDRKDKQRYIAFAETRDGQKIVELVHGVEVGDYKVKVVLKDKLVITDKKGKSSEVMLGQSFKGGVIGKETVYGGSSSSSSAAKTTKTTKTSKPLPKLSGGKKMSIIERLKARRAAQMKKKKGKQ